MAYGSIQHETGLKRFFPAKWTRRLRVKPKRPNQRSGRASLPMWVADGDDLIDRHSARGHGGEIMETRPSVTYSALHNPVSEGNNDLDNNDMLDEDEFEEIELHSHHHKHHVRKESLESFDFNDVESMMWRKVSISIYSSI